MKSVLGEFKIISVLNKIVAWHKSKGQEIGFMIRTREYEKTLAMEVADFGKRKNSLIPIIITIFLFVFLSASLNT